MLVKRIFPQGVEVRQKRDAQGNVVKDRSGNPVREEIFEECVVRFLNAPRPRQKFRDGLVAKGVGEGWMSVGKGQITIHTEDGQDDVVYRIVAVPNKAERRNYYDCELEA